MLSAAAFFNQLADRIDAVVQIFQDAIFDTVDPTVHGKFYAIFPCVLHDGRIAYVDYLLHYI